MKQRYIIFYLLPEAKNYQRGSDALFYAALPICLILDDLTSYSFV